jgi:outer membrane protein OmpA-like peptidoglycan-associated protein
MHHNTFKLILATTLVAVLSGCSSYVVRTSDPNSAFCTLAGAGIGGGGAALASAGGPIIAGGVMLGATIGNYICSSDGTPVAQPVQQVAAAPAPQPAPAPVVQDRDSDNDGVIDRLDRCPNTPAGAKVDANGCPEVLMTLTGVNFAYDSSQIDSSSVRILDQAVAALNEASTVRIRIVGHTDSRGSDEYNQALSVRRANAVRDYFVSKGISASRLTTSGEGESRPVASNNTDDGRHQNRRVELHVVDSTR